MPEGPVTVYRHRDSTLSGTVIFPITDAQSKGLEDLRLVKFRHDDGEEEWLGTYTAYNGSVIQSELMRTKDFRAFDLVPMTGPAARNKGIALFPRKVGGQICRDRAAGWGESLPPDLRHADPLGRG